MLITQQFTEQECARLMAARSLFEDGQLHDRLEPIQWPGKCDEAARRMRLAIRSGFTPSGVVRLEIARTAVRHGFYTDWPAR